MLAAFFYGCRSDKHRAAVAGRGVGAALHLFRAPGRPAALLQGSQRPGAPTLPAGLSRSAAEHASLSSADAASSSAAVCIRSRNPVWPQLLLLLPPCSLGAPAAPLLQVLCWRDATFGRHSWQLPRCARPHPDATERCAVFAAALLEGKVLPSFAGETARGAPLLRSAHGPCWLLAACFAAVRCPAGLDCCQLLVLTLPCRFIPDCRPAPGAGGASKHAAPTRYAGAQASVRAAGGAGRGARRQPRQPGGQVGAGAGILAARAGAVHAEGVCWRTAAGLGGAAGRGCRWCSSSSGCQIVSIPCPTPSCTRQIS